MIRAGRVFAHSSGPLRVIAAAVLLFRLIAIGGFRRGGPEDFQGARVISAERLILGIASPLTGKVFFVMGIAHNSEL